MPTFSDNRPSGKLRTN